MSRPAVALNLSNCANIDAASIALLRLKSLTPRLACVDLRGCELLTQRAVLRALGGRRLDALLIDGIRAGAVGTVDVFGQKHLGSPDRAAARSALRLFNLISPTGCDVQHVCTCWRLVAAFYDVACECCGRAFAVCKARDCRDAVARAAPCGHSACFDCAHGGAEERCAACVAGEAAAAEDAEQAALAAEEWAAQRPGMVKRSAWGSLGARQGSECSFSNC